MYEFEHSRSTADSHSIGDALSESATHILTTVKPHTRVSSPKPSENGLNTCKEAYAENVGRADKRPSCQPDKREGVTIRPAPTSYPFDESSETRPTAHSENTGSRPASRRSNYGSRMSRPLTKEQLNPRTITHVPVKRVDESTRIGKKSRRGIEEVLQERDVRANCFW